MGSMQTKMLIGGRFAAGTEAEEKILDPKTEETILDLPEASAEQIDAAGGDILAHLSGRDGKSSVT